MGLRLGKKSPRIDARTLQFSKYAVKNKKTPGSVAWGNKVSNWALFKNDKIGCCTCASAGHSIECWTANALNSAVTLNDQAIVSAYSAVSGYDPRTGANDRGANMLSVLSHWRKNGIGGRKIVAYTSLSESNIANIKQAIYLFGSIYVGLELPISAANQAVWDVSKNGGEAGSWGGHAVSVVGYDSFGLTLVTWGGVKKMTWRFWGAYCDESYAVVSSDWIARNRKSPSGFDINTLLGDLKKITG